jgi:hypothetical protein
MGINYNSLVKKNQKDFEAEYQKRLDRCLPVAEEIMKMVVESKLPMGTLGDKKGEMKEDVRETYESFSAKVLAYMLNSNMHYMDKDFVFQLIFQPFEQVKNIVVNAVNRSFERSEEILFKKDILDIDFQDIHEILLRNAEEQLQKQQK